MADVIGSRHSSEDLHEVAGIFSQKHPCRSTVIRKARQALPDFRN